MPLAASEVEFAYGSRAVLRGATLVLEPGVTAILGPNGAGKSTLLRAMLGLIAPTRGRVEIDGMPVASMPERERASRLIYMPQSASPAFGYSVEDVVSMGRYALPRRAGAVRAALERVGLSGRAGEAFASLSAGQQQLASLARALAQADGPRSAAILADEPSSAMDPAHQALCARVLREEASRGVAIAIVLHDFGFAARVADRAAILVEGRVAESGPAREVLAPEAMGACFGVRFARYTDQGGNVLVAPAHEPA